MMWFVYLACIACFGVCYAIDQDFSKLILVGSELSALVMFFGALIVSIIQIRTLRQNPKDPAADILWLAASVQIAAPSVGWLFLASGNPGFATVCFSLGIVCSWLIADKVKSVKKGILSPPV